ncbi:Restriction endonuclease [Candidatus Methylopumilus planktonicus]|uniref:Restriction endonuclease n=1 Tax=Candidatus Methylopumilus planktonicus TaxID=1581557 RepID=A0A0D6EUL7_9PROT|nr:Bpu10I family restriction endonuclease [Candidatus Methylopumilus planktonicus]CEZ19395.1 Restriction endonuclease [Candidatus Methylopumilus planktonicus]
MLVHGNNLEQKEQHQTKYQDKDSKKYLVEIREKYNSWKKKNETLIGPLNKTDEKDSKIIEDRVSLLNEYKDFLDQQHFAEKFDSRSNLHSSVLEEFMYYLFRDLVAHISPYALIGKSHSFKDLFFRANSFDSLIKKPNALIEKKDHDFAIGTSVKAEMSCRGSDEIELHDWDIPAVAIECKTYLDKTMLQDASTAAEQLKQKNPNALYIVVAEWLKLTESVNLKKYKIDQIYVLRKQKNTDREFRYDIDYVKNPIYSDVIEHCFFTVRNFLIHDWEGGISHGLEKGFLI